MMFALISPTFSLFRISTGTLPSRICWRISGTHLGHSESVSRGQPSLGFCFSQLFSSGLSDHFGVKDGFWLIEFSLSKTNQAALAATATAFSTCLIGLSKVRSPDWDEMRELPQRSSIVSGDSASHINELKCRWLHWTGL